MRFLFKVRLMSLSVASSAKEFKTVRVVAPSFTHRIAVMYIQSPTLSPTALAAMAGSGEHLADCGVGDSLSFGLGNT